MFKNYLKTALRHLYRNKFYTFIKIFGLAIGLAATMLILIFIRHELQYDKFHENYNRIYRVISNVQRPGSEEMIVPSSMADASRVIAPSVPEIEASVKMYHRGLDVQHEEDIFPEQDLYFVDSSFSKVFSFPVLHGNLDMALAQPLKVILTETSANKYFGKTDVIGEELEMYGGTFTVGCVLKEIPSTSHFRFDVLTPFVSMQDEEAFYRDHGFDFFTYLVGPSNEVSNNWQEKFCSMTDSLASVKLNEYGAAGAFKVNASLQPLSRVHLYSDVRFDIAPQGDVKRVYMFAFLAFFILLIAIINFVNLVTAHSEYRTREVGMRKVMGAGRKGLIKQYLGESIIVSFIAMIIAFVVVELFAEPFGLLLGRELEFSFEQLDVVGLFVLLSLLVGVVSGAYPAFYISRFNPIRIFKGKSSKSNKRRLQIALVVVQFTISIFLIGSVIIFNAQIHYLGNKNLGFAKEQVLVVRNISYNLMESYSALRDELLQNPDIKELTGSQSIPGELRSVQNAYIVGEDPSSSIIINENNVQDNYVETFGLELIEGRSFDRNLASDSSAFILNESAVKALGLEEPVGSEIQVWQNKGRVIGVIRDYHFTSFREKIEPLVLTRYSPYFAHISLRISDANKYKEVLDYIQATLKTFDQDYQFQYTFMDAHFEQLYQEERRANRLIMHASVLAILISMLGLFALTSVTVVKRGKEVAIRKAIGARTSEVTFLLLKDTLKWVLLVNVIAWPLIYYVMKGWLENFAYRIELKLWMFLLASIIALVIAFITVFALAKRASERNPAIALRDE